MKRFIKTLPPLVFFASFATTAAIAQLLTVDEFGNGRFQTTNGIQVLPFTLAPDPTGGLTNWPVLIYTLPFAGLQGDLLIQDPFESGSPILDVIRFDGNFHLIFYSDSIDGFTSRADTPGPPDPFFSNQFFVNEQGDEQFSFADYTPAAGQPGRDLSNPSYRFVSDGLVPEPGTNLLLLTGLAVFGLARFGAKLVSRH